MKSFVSALLVLLAFGAPAAADPNVAGLVPAAWPPPVALMARVPEGGLWFAALDDAFAAAAHFYIYRVDRAGVTEVHRDDHSTVYSFGWSDADTLWTLAFAGSDITSSEGVIVTRFVRGQKDKAYRVAHDSWLGPRSDVWVRLFIGADGEVALSRCEETDTDAIPEVCLKESKRRLEGDAWVYRKRLGKHTRDAMEARWEPTIGKATKPAAGYKVTTSKVDDVRGLRCKGPNGEDTWPKDDVLNREMQVQPKKITWLYDKPPLFVIEGPRNTPIETLRRSTQVLTGCPMRAMPGFHWLGDGIWAELVDLNDTAFSPWQWKIWIDETHVASLHGELGGLVPAPRR